MRTKSKFFTFLLSFIPGLSHFYLGFATRGLIFFLVVFADIFFTVLLGNLVADDFVFLFFTLPIIWLVALVDSMLLIDKLRGKKDSLNYNYSTATDSSADSPAHIDSLENIGGINKKIITMVLSIIPGAGHMYLGYQNQGLQLMSLFFFSLFFIDWLHISFLMSILPVVWFYSMFDALNKLPDESQVKDDNIIDLSYFKNKHKLIGYFLLFLGGLLLLERVVAPAIDIVVGLNISRYINTIIVSSLFIWGGIKLIKNNTSSFINNKGDDVKCNNGE